MGQLVFQATAGGQVALVGPNPSTNFSLNVPAVNSTLATLNAQTFTGQQTDTVDASISGLTVGKGGGGVSSNTVVGNGALAANSTQGDIVAVGYLAAAALTGNNQTTVVGSNAFKSSTSANGDAFGYQALTANTTGSNNSAFAYRALYLSLIHI